MRINVATKWSELTEWQLGQLALLLLTGDTEEEKIPFRIVEILFKKDNSLRSQIRYAKLINDAPFSTLITYSEFLNKLPDLYHFPDLSSYGVTAPGDRLNTISVRQFSVADAIFYKWRATNEERYLQQLVAALYTVGDFNVLELPKIADLTANVTREQLYVIGLTYLSVRNWITEQFPTVFPRAKKKEQEQDVPVFHTEREYTPFSKVIAAMAMDERQPLGPMKDCEATRLQDFLLILTESIHRTELQNKNNGR